MYVYDVHNGTSNLMHTKYLVQIPGHNLYPHPPPPATGASGGGGGVASWLGIIRAPGSTAVCKYFAVFLYAGVNKQEAI